MPPSHVRAGWVQIATGSPHSKRTSRAAVIRPVSGWTRSGTQEVDPDW